MNAALSELTLPPFLQSLPFITTVFDADLRVVQQFNADDTPLFTPAGQPFFAENLNGFTQLQEAVQTTEATPFATECVSGDGAARWYEHQIVRVVSNHCMVLSRDITAQKRAEAEFVQYKRRYDAIINNVSDGIAVSTWGTGYDENSLITVNRRTEKMFGYSLEELRKIKPSDMLAPEDREAAFKNRELREQNKLKEEVPRPLLAKRRDGAMLNLESLAFIVNDEQGNKIEVITMFRDVTDRIEREEQLRQAKLAAEAALTARDVFVANMSQELREPLDQILEHMRLLAQRISLSDEAQQRLFRIEALASNLRRQITDILDLSRVEAGFDVVETTLFNLPYLLKRMEDNLQVKAQQQQVELNFDIADDLPILVQSDEAKLKQILVSLVGDSLKLTDSDSISVQVASAHDHTLTISITGVRATDPSGAAELIDADSLAERVAVIVSKRLIEALSGHFEITPTAEGVSLTIQLPFVPVRSVSASSDMPELPSSEQLSTLPVDWLNQLYVYCSAGQQAEALAHVEVLTGSQRATGIQLGAIIQLFHLDLVADLVEPLL